MSSSSSTTEPDVNGTEPDLKRVMGPKLLLLFIVGDILGAGVYAVTGKLAGQVGGIAWLPFLVAFAVATVTAFSYLELVTKYPQAAGAALYTHKAFGLHFVTFLVAFAVVCSGITSASTSSNLLATNLLTGLDVRQSAAVSAVGPGPAVDGRAYDAVVLALPDPQAAPLLDPSLLAERAAVADRVWEPVLALAAGWDDRHWPQEFDGCFVEGSEVLGWVADDGRRRGDGAPVLVAHSTSPWAAGRLVEPEVATAGLLDALLGLAQAQDAPAGPSAPSADQGAAIEEMDVDDLVRAALAGGELS